MKQLPPGHDLAAAGLTAGREAAQGFTRYPTRAEIDAGALKGQGLEILYLPDAIDAFIMHVQGSGRIELDDGTVARLTFDGKNGHPYTSVARRLIERGDLKVEDADLEGMIAWLRAQPDPTPFLQENASYAFFREARAPALVQPEASSHPFAARSHANSPRISCTKLYKLLVRLIRGKSCQGPQQTGQDFPRGVLGPTGSMGVELFAGRSLAADPLYHCLGMPIWVSAPDLVFSGAPFRRLAIAQDTGSAIRGPQRGDIFVGSGAEAGRVAGRVRHRCEFTILAPRC